MQQCLYAQAVMINRKESENKEENFSTREPDFYKNVSKNQG